MADDGVTSRKQHTTTIIFLPEFQVIHAISARFSCISDMVHKARYYSAFLHQQMAKPFVHSIFGARQTGQSTIIQSLLPDRSTIINLADPRERARFAVNPGMFIQLCQALPGTGSPATVFVDEARMGPALFDAVQYLYDGDKQRYRFILCGSSARRLVFGDLPGIALLQSDDDRADILSAYATAYLDEEIRRETVVKDWGYFLRFLKFAAGDSGGIVNYSGVSRETGIASATVKAYYQLL